jgi:5-methylcytosine-specific restriction endonuclease McrA
MAKNFNGVTVRACFRFNKAIFGYCVKDKMSPFTIASAGLIKLGFTRGEMSIKEFLFEHRDILYKHGDGVETKRKKEKKYKGDDFLNSYEWRVLRMRIIVKYGAKCQCCGATPKDGIVINVDHIKPRKLFPELALDENNLQILCNVCNHGKSNWDDTDWRK